MYVEDPSDPHQVCHAAMKANLNHMAAVAALTGRVAHPVKGFANPFGGEIGWIDATDPEWVSAWFAYARTCGEIAVMPPMLTLGNRWRQPDAPWLSFAPR